ncbi:MAG: prolyl oligopeptidase family serine peptidase, partial [Chitinophagaceae bacterium]
DLIQNHGVRNENTILPANKPLLLTGFWENTKQNGFFKLEMNKKNGLQLLSVQSSLIYANPKQTIKGLTVHRAKADNADVWIVKKQTMADAPNFVLTSDFKSFKQLTDIQPQKKYRWATSELLSWKMPDGRACQGILYRPEDFDTTRKYPVIINYYEKHSARLHQFLRPSLIDADLNIPWFVSRGYLVFVPDIHYTVGKVAKSVVNSILPGVDELIKRRFVDSLAIGIQGHSFGGYETNILITEANLFAAAVEGAGASDLISQYGSLLPSDRSNGTGVQGQEKGGQYRVDGLLWENQRTYIENSPIFKADKVTTPLLIFHNKGDEAVPWGQAVELFIALRRLEKPVWMLQYDQGGHGVNTAKDQMDYTTRMTQFFDHYLKRAPAPKWMTHGIPASMKSIETGYALDPAGNCGMDCKVCKKWNVQFIRTPDRFLNSESDWRLDKDLE